MQLSLEFAVTHLPLENLAFQLLRPVRAAMGCVALSWARGLQAITGILHTCPWQLASGLEPGKNAKTNVTLVLSLSEQSLSCAFGMCAGPSAFQLSMDLV